LSRDELETRLGLKLTAPVAVATYHPVTLESADAQKQVKELLAALEQFSMTVIFTKANADPQGTKVNAVLENFCKRNPKRYKLFDNLGQRLYYSCLKNADVMLGNSSSGLLEAPVFCLPAVNIGDRQKNRIRPASVIDVDCRTAEIIKGIRRALSMGFRRSLKKVNNPYGRSGRIGERIKNQLKRLPLNEDVIKKKFFDLPVKAGKNGRS
jgi:UDP-hydrolysing UDP-N-acetyl-D-glucosamine 2-epimerase